jgi:hypothetical protein
MLLIFLANRCISDRLVPVCINVSIEPMIDEIIIGKVSIAVVVGKQHQTLKA